MEEKDHTLSLTKMQLISLFTFYIILLIGSLFEVMRVLREFIDVTTGSSVPIWIVLYGSFLSAVIGSGVYYTRKLYKLCIRRDLEMPPSSGSKEWGCAIYFLTRPLFSCAFALLIVLSLHMENQFVSTSRGINSTNFIYVAMFVSFLSGFSAGKVISILEKKGAPINAR